MVNPSSFGLCQLIQKSVRDLSFLAAAQGISVLLVNPFAALLAIGVRAGEIQAVDTVVIIYFTIRWREVRAETNVATRQQRIKEDNPQVRLLGKELLREA